jgi:tripartite-type tricarboxylate transporter receptor subunit TctC
MYKIKYAMHRKACLVALALLISVVSIGFAPKALAQSYPNKPIRFIVPYPPGGGTDIVARLIAAKMTLSMGQVVLVDNKPGASTIIGTEMLARAPADGYTIGFITSSHLINPLFFPKLPFDSIKDFEPISLLVSLPLVLVVHPSLNVKTISELIAAAKARPGKINYASIGNGTPHHLVAEWLKSMAVINMTHIPYKGVAPALNDLVAGQIDIMFTGTSSASPYVKAGKVIALAVSTAKREPSFPNTPTVAETTGLSEFDYTTWYGVSVPVGTPREVKRRLNQEIAAALNQPDVKETLASLGVVGTPSSPEEFGAFLKTEAQKITRIIKTSGIKQEPD